MSHLHLTNKFGNSLLVYCDDELTLFGPKLKDKINIVVNCGFQEIVAIDWTQTDRQQFPVRELHHFFLIRNTISVLDWLQMNYFLNREMTFAVDGHSGDIHFKYMMKAAKRHDDMYLLYVHGERI